MTLHHRSIAIVCIMLICPPLSLSFRQADHSVTAQPVTKQKHSAAIALLYPNGLALDASGDLYISDIGTHRVYKLDVRKRLHVIAGTGVSGFGGDGGRAVIAQLSSPHDLAFDSQGNLLIADTGNQRIRRLDRQGILTTIAGNGKADYAGDGGAAVNASLNNPQGITADRAGNLLIADTYNHVIRRINPQGIIATIAGTVPGHGGDGGVATKAQVNLTMAVTTSPDGSIYLSDAANSRIRQITGDGIIRTIAGFGPAADTYGGGFAGDGGPAEKAKIFSATDLKCDAAGNLYISDSGNHRIRMIRKGIITTIAGSGRQGFGGDGGKAVAAELNTPQKIVIAGDGSIFIADRASHRVRKVDTQGIIQTIAGPPANLRSDSVSRSRRGSTDPR